MPDAWLWERGENPTGKGGWAEAQKRVRGERVCVRRRVPQQDGQHTQMCGEPAVSFSDILSFSWPSVAAVES